MSDFDTIDRSRRMARNSEKPTQRPKGLCQADGCDARWTHSDTPGGGMGMCGMHYYLRQGHAQLEAWKARNAKVRQDLRNHGRSPA